MSELSSLLPDTAWLAQLTVTDTGVQLSGQASSAAPLLGVLNQAASLEKAAFSRSLARAEDGERFQIAATRRMAEPFVPATSPPPGNRPAADDDDSQAMTTLGLEAKAAQPAELDGAASAATQSQESPAPEAAPQTEVQP